MHSKNHLTKNIFTNIKNTFNDIPRDIRNVSLSLFLYVFGRGLGGDTFFSLYIDSIVNNVIWISIISATLSLSKMFFSITVGEEDDHTNIKSVILFNKVLYVFIGALYFLAGVTGSLGILIITVLLNGIASASIFTTYQAFIRKHTKQGGRGRAFGLYFVAINIGVMLGALIASALIKFMDIHVTYLFIPVFAMLSFLVDKKLPSISKTQRKRIFGKESFFHKYIRDVFSFRPIKEVVVTLKNYSSRMYYALGFEMLFSMLNYIGFIFVPIVSIANNLSLSQVAIVFAVMRFPYIIDLFVNNFSAKNSKRKVLFLILLFLSLLYLLLGYNESFRNILIITFGISCGLALMRPIISAYVSDCTNPKEEGTISGVAEFVAKAGEVIGVLLFGILSLVFGVQGTFVFIGFLILAISVGGLIQRYRMFNKKTGTNVTLLNKNIPPPPIGPTGQA